MGKNKKPDIPLGEVSVSDGVIRLNLEKTRFRPNNIYFEDKVLYYGSPTGARLKVRDPKVFAIFIYNLHIYNGSIFASEVVEELEACMALIYVTLLNEN